MDQTPETKPHSPEPAIAPVKTPSRLQRIIEHGLSFLILTPAIASFFAFLVTVALFVPIHGGADGVIGAFAITKDYLISTYIIGAVPSLLVGLLAYPLWRQFGGGWQFYVVAALFNATLCAAVSTIFLGASVQSISTVAAFAGAATLASVFLTRKLRL